MVATLFLVLQILFTVAAGWLLWKAWRYLSAIHPLAGTLIGAGLIIRSILAQAIFWISYLHLPIARSLQTGDGFWALAIDGRLYFELASQALTQGFGAVVLIQKSLPSPAFVQVLAVFQFLFGPAASVGAFLNIFAYLGTCAAILRLGRTAGGGIATPALIAIAAFSFAPGVIMWSLQPLKDPFFIFTIAAFVVACTMWQEAWRERFSPGRFFAPLLLMLIVLYAVVGIRWYFGVVLWLASVPYFATAAWRSNRRGLAAAANAVVFLALSQVIVFGAGPYVPRQLRIQFGNDPQAPDRTIAETVVLSRRSFDAARANTMIEAGDALQEVDDTFGEPQLEVARRPASPARSAQLTETDSQPVAAVTPAPLPERAPPPSKTTSSAVVPAAPISQAPRSERHVAPESGSSKTSVSTTPVTEQKPRDETHAAASPASAPPAATDTELKASTSPQSLPDKTKTVHEAPPPVKIVPNAVTRPSEPKVRRTHARKPVVLPPGRAQIMPRSTFSRVAAGLTALVLPHFLGERLGLIHVGGGRGLWAIVETDTLFFDGLLFLVLYYVFRALRHGAWRNPSFWLVGISTAVITVLLAYMISNFGTLFRHRAMILIGLCLLLVVARDMRPSADLHHEELIPES